VRSVDRRSIIRTQRLNKSTDRSKIHDCMAETKGNHTRIVRCYVCHFDTQQRSVGKHGFRRGGKGCSGEHGKPTSIIFGSIWLGPCLEDQLSSTLVGVIRYLQGRLFPVSRPNESTSKTWKGGQAFLQGCSKAIFVHLLVVKEAKSNGRDGRLKTIHGGQRVSACFRPQGPNKVRASRHGVVDSQDRYMNILVSLGLLYENDNNDISFLARMPDGPGFH